MKKAILRQLGSFIWFYSELFHIPLGRFTPVCFGWMIGHKGTLINEDGSPKELK